MVLELEFSDDFRILTSLLRLAIVSLEIIGFEDGEAIMICS